MTRELSLSSPSSVRDSIYKLWRKFTAPNSTSAIRTGQHWTDDKPIYRKVVPFAAGPNNNTVNTAHGITGLGTIISVSGVMSNGTTTRGIVATEATGVLQANWAIDATNFIHFSGVGGDYSAYAGHVVIEYTLA